MVGLVNSFLGVWQERCCVLMCVFLCVFVCVLVCVLVCACVCLHGVCVHSRLTLVSSCVIYHALPTKVA